MAPVRVLITGAGAPGIKGTLHSLKNNWDGRDTYTVGVDMQENAVGKYLCDSFYRIPPASDDDFIPALLEIVEKEKVDVILPQVTMELFPLSRHRKEIESSGAEVAVSSPEAIEIANNKARLMEFARKTGVPVPEFYQVSSWDELEKHAQRLGYPFVVKPPVASGMRGLRVVYYRLDRKEAFFREKPDSSRITLQELENILGEEFPPLLVMEYLSGMEYSVDILSSKEKVYAVIPRRRDRIRSGITFEGTVEKRDDIIGFSERIASHIGLEYAHGLQFKEDREGIPRLIESNPRVQGTMVLSTVAGANIVYGAVKLALGEDIPEFDVRWGARLLRYWGGVGVINGREIEI